MTERNITRRGIIGGIAAGAGLVAAAASDVGTAQAQSTQKTFVLIHGSWGIELLTSDF